MKLLLRKVVLPVVALVLSGASAALAQTGGVTVGASTPANASAALDIVSTTKGLLPPRLTQAQITAISNPATGLLVFQTDGVSDYYYNAGTSAAPAWQAVVGLTASSPLTGAGTSGSPLGINVASTSQAGALSAADFTTFNNKLGTASNGLTKTGTNVALGGTLTAATTLTTGTNTFAVTQDAAPLLTTTDQINYTNNPSANPTGSNYQSFTAGVTGTMTNVEVQAGGSAGTTVSFLLSIRSGTGIGGALLYKTGASFVTDGSSTSRFIFPVDVAVTSGQVYTIQITDPNNRFTWILDGNNPYAGGSSSYDPAGDFFFRTVVRRTGTAVSSFPIITTTGGKVGIGTTTPAFMLDVNGEIRCANLIQSSDVRLKQNIRPLGNALAAVQALRGVRYTFRQAEFPAKNLPAGEQIGFLAQEVEKVYPELVSTDAQGYKAVNYAQLTPVLLEALKEQQAEIEALKARAATAESKAAQATAATEGFEDRLRRLEAGTGQARR